MKSAIDKFGRVLIPKSIRDHLGLRAGSAVQIQEQDHKIVLMLIESKSPLERKNGILVFTGEAEGDIESAIQNSRDERMKDVW